MWIIFYKNLSETAKQNQRAIDMHITCVVPISYYKCKNWLPCKFLKFSLLARVQISLSLLAASFTYEKIKKSTHTWVHGLKVCKAFSVSIFFLFFSLHENKISIYSHGLNFNNCLLVNSIQFNGSVIFIHSVTSPKLSHNF